MTEEKTKKSTQNTRPGIGCDLGTMNIVSARRTPEGVITNRIRDAFLDFPAEHRKMLKLSNVNYVTTDDGLIIVGDAAYDMANMLSREVRRPLESGLIAPGELYAIEILGILVKHVLGDPLEKDEICYFSLPAEPIDARERDVVYHRGILERIVTECGFKAYAGNEAMAIIYSECAQDGFSGIAFSFGSGLTNVALAMGTIEGLSFSISKGGDWIDRGAAKSVGSTQARMCALKEKGLNLMHPQSRDEEALVVYYKSLIEYALDNVAAEFDKIKGKFALPNPIPIVVSGGTSKAGGFLEFFIQVFEEKRKNFPIKVSEIRAAKEPLDAVARGLLVQSLQEYDEE